MRPFSVGNSPSNEQHPSRLTKSTCTFNRTCNEILRAHLLIPAHTRPSTRPPPAFSRSRAKGALEERPYGVCRPRNSLPMRQTETPGAAQWSEKAKFPLRQARPHPDSPHRCGIWGSFPLDGDFLARFQSLPQLPATGISPFLTVPLGNSALLTIFSSAAFSDVAARHSRRAPAQPASTCRPPAPVRALHLRFRAHARRALWKNAPTGSHDFANPCRSALPVKPATRGPSQVEAKRGRPKTRRAQREPQESRRSPQSQRGRPGCPRLPRREAKRTSYAPSFAQGARWGAPAGRSVR